MMYTLILVEARTIEELRILISSLDDGIVSNAKDMSLNEHTGRFPLDHVITREFQHRFVRMKVVESEP